MNTTPADTPLPEIGEERIDAMERTVFARIAADRHARRTRRGRWWMGGAAAAAVVLVAAVISPYVASSISGGGSSGASSESAAVESGALPGSPVTVIPGEQAVPLTGTVELDASAADGSSTEAATESAGAREIATTAAAAMIVDDVADAAREIGADAEARGGYVESVSVDSPAGTLDQSTRAEDSLRAPYPSPVGGGSITVRVPSAELTDAVEALDAVGEVTSSNIGRQDVTDQAVDLRARVAASEASVARLTELIGQAESVADLLTAESALAERQATLDADRQQLESIENLVALSTLSVQLTPPTAVVEADPAGFGDGLAAGWNGLVATLNGIVIALGFLLPWLVVIGILAALAWGVVRLVRRARSRPRGGSAAAADRPTPADD
jgi:hypothetical protein